MPSPKIDRVRGVSDILPDDFAKRKQIEEKLKSCFESFGYRPIDVPVIEHTDLYLKKSGEDIIARLYDFTYQNRRLCLRPEMTASVVRAYIDNLQDAPLPVRLYYAGPVFRYEKPQRGRHRQFTQIGVELLGAAERLADAEIIYLACKGLDQLGLSGYRAVIGHIGILSEFLRSLELDSRLQNFLLANMEMLHRNGEPYLVSLIRELYPSFRADEAKDNASREPIAENEERAEEKLREIFLSRSEADAREAIHELLKKMNIALDGNRSPDEIIDRLLDKMKRNDQTPRINQALEFMKELGQLAGEPSKVLPEVEKLLAAHNMSRAPLEQLRAMIETLTDYPIDWSRVTIDFGLSRGLQYYTDMIFEIHHGAIGDDQQLCGGGRYDDLVATLGGAKEIHAVGFSYGLERLLLALQSEGKLICDNHDAIKVLVISVSAKDRSYAIEVAERLRRDGLNVEMDVRGRNVKSSFQYADKQDMRFAIVVGADEKRASQVFVKHLASRQERRLKINDALEWINKMKSDDAK